MPYWISPTAKLKRLLGLSALIVLLFLPLLAYKGFDLAQWFFLFPEGLLVLLPSYVYFQYIVLFVVLVWLLYLGISVGIVISKNKSVVRILFTVLIVLLLVNIGGCYRAMWNFVP